MDEGDREQTQYRRELARLSEWKYIGWVVSSVPIPFPKDNDLRYTFIRQIEDGYYYHLYKRKVVNSDKHRAIQSPI